MEGLHPAQRRARSQLSCTACRQGKLRCDRSHPCNQCIKRSRDTSCSYLAPPQKKKPNQNMRDRVKHLESLVVDLMSNMENKSPKSSDPSNPSRSTSVSESSKESESPLTSTNSSRSPGDSSETGNSTTTEQTDVEVDPTAFGNMQISKDETKWSGPLHWETVLNDIQEVKAELGDNEEPDESPGDDAQLPESQMTPLFILGAAAPYGRAQLMEQIPKKPEADELISRWFNAFDPLTMMIHRPTFQQEYYNFWSDPSNVPITWIAMLCGIMSLSATLRYVDEQDTAPADALEKCVADMNQYHGMAAIAMSLGDFSKPTAYTVEALMVYAECEFIRGKANQMRVWLLTGLILRVALRMGYHRDSKHFPNISPFAGEMRRRVWWVLYQFDILGSFQLGLPSMVRAIQSDTACPRNLHDSDFGVDSKELPPARPTSELTNASYSTGKMALSTIFGKATDFSHALTEPTEEEVMQLDRELQDAYAKLPESLKSPRMNEYLTITHSTELLLCSINIGMLYQKTRCVLHRRFLKHSKGDERYKYSRDSCISAAISLLEHHKTLDIACRPGGLLWKYRWYTSTVSTHDFLLAAMILCLELSNHQQNSCDANLSNIPLPCLEQFHQIHDGLQSTYEIFQKTEPKTTELKQALSAMAIMLQKVRGPLVRLAKVRQEQNMKNCMC
ncbi:hypothetical protein P152DRAFT_401661 [Eremomyces bilateralis CBS 781.70]|uniref:Zn(2)-C6 fungal-type domain-containing protein n=1 Tax=Eremomyces bilateralis CBS 781.70 TaxID=1392243 RepID=A0A6G1FWU3_9PEZI|nr:uncharacterized protein P152DRAFT_401661 [Eremomyces bilateralis CBS 781.70]KAF1810208.1 hypothetical protein P152DRAFT_401661 [Eremomyces bilateralis CBS 781.70]